MVSDRIAWPRKTRELRTQLFDSSVWNEFRFRPDDVVIATYGKAGTTWTQQIVAQLIFGGREGIDVATLSPWLDMRFPPKEVKLALLEAQAHRRFIKTHLPADALVFSPDAKYIYVARDGRDVVWSLYNHHANVTDEWQRRVNDAPDRVGPPLTRPPASIRQYFLEWLAARWLSLLVVLGECLVLVGDPAPAQRAVPALCGSQARSTGSDPEDRGIPRDQARRGGIRCGRPTLQLRLHEGARREERAGRRPPLQGRRPDLHPQRDERPLARRPERGGLPPLRGDGARASRPAVRTLARRGWIDRPR